MTQQYSEPERGLSVKFTYLLLLRYRKQKCVIELYTSDGE